MEKEIVFKIKTYTWQELSQLYNPEKSPLAAAKRLRRWVFIHPKLKPELMRLGWRQGNHLLTPLQEGCIVQYQGES